LRNPEPTLNRDVRVKAMMKVILETSVHDVKVP
jgi:hypothetical protein